MTSGTSRYKTSIFAGGVCLPVFYGLEKLPIQIFSTFDQILYQTNSMSVVTGPYWFLGAGIADLFSKFHWTEMGAFDKMGLLDNRNAVQRALLGSTVIVALGMGFPKTCLG